MYDLIIGILLVRIFSSMLQEGEINLEKSAITLKYAMDAERIYSFTEIYDLRYILRISYTNSVILKCQLFASITLQCKSSSKTK